MNTKDIKTFAQKARLLLLEGVSQRLSYWGFNEEGECKESLVTTEGGYIFRGQIATDTSVPGKWKKLKTRISDAQAYKDLREEAAYTWFNRLMAIKILEENGYIPPTLSYAEGLHTPIVVQNAKKGGHSLNQQADKKLLLEYLRADKEELALGLLITNLCNQHSLLRNIFGRIDDYTELLLPQNLLQKDGLIDLINSDAISTEDYHEVELIGWLYQFYISDRKDEVFKGFKEKKKARAEDIPAATQIFTPKWIVQYMVENTVGKLYLDYEPSSSLRDEMKYLVQNDSDTENEPVLSDITELSLIDPAAGSGHILVVGFELLLNMYREEGYTAKKAVAHILEHNLFGLDIDDRAMQLARFAVLLKAAQYYPEILSPNSSPLIPKIYSFPEASHFTSEELQNFLGHDGHQFTAELKEALQLLNQGKNIGSAIKLELSEQAHQHIEKRYDAWLQKSNQGRLDIEQSIIWTRLYPFLDVMLVLTKKYTSVVANPPYMGQKSMNGELKAYVKTQYPLTKSDLFAVFMEVCLSLNVSKGLMGMINQHSWMFLSSYEKLRNEILDNYSIVSMLHLGPRTFEELSGEVVQSTAFVIENSNPKSLIPNPTGVYYRLLDYRNNADKEKNFLQRNNCHPNIPQTNFSKIPGSPIAYWISKRILESFTSLQTFQRHGNAKVGMQTAKNDYFLRRWPEINYKSFAQNSLKWIPYIKGGGFRRWYGNLDLVLRYGGDGGELKKIKNATLCNKDILKLPKCSWSDMSTTFFHCRISPNWSFYDIKGHSFFPKEENQHSLLAWTNSKLFQLYADLLNPTTSYQVGDINRIPTSNSIIGHNSLSNLGRQCVKISQYDWDSRETSWDFEKSPLLGVRGQGLGSRDEKNLSLATSPLSLKEAYEYWREQVSKDFFQLHANEEELNRIFIDIYGLKDELTPEVAFKDITILQEELSKNDLEALEPVFREQGKEAINLPINKAEVISQFISYGIGVFLGRYRLDKPGLNIAHPNPTEEENAKYQYNRHNIEVDEDGILPLMGEDCAFPDDALVRTKDMVYAIWGEESLTENINFIHEALGMDLHKWLTEKFWKYHTGMYKKKPIYWLFSSHVKKPQKAGFKVLVYMHRMDKYTVQKIQRNYLHPHQEYLNREIQKMMAREESLNQKEVKRLEQFRAWALECRDYNETLKELATQQIEFDLDDGVKVNYAKFEGAVAKI